MQACDKIGLKAINHPCGVELSSLESGFVLAGRHALLAGSKTAHSNASN
jgi:hypothetical protein